ncbi:MAG: hypothetical protein WCL21_19350 [Mariniphaga sp.]
MKYWELFSFFNIPELCALWDETEHWESALFSPNALESFSSTPGLITKIAGS